MNKVVENAVEFLTKRMNDKKKKMIRRSKSRSETRVSSGEEEEEGGGGGSERPHRVVNEVMKTAATRCCSVSLDPPKLKPLQTTLLKTQRVPLYTLELE